MDRDKTIIIGGGFYGLRLALFLYEELGVKDIVVLEKEPTIMSRASYVNQARVHNGYHYPRSLLTAYRSHINFTDFVKEYEPAIKSDFSKYYAIARTLSKVNAKQFEGFVRKIGADIEDVSANIQNIFNPKLIEKGFLVKEYAFDSHKLAKILAERIERTGSIEVLNNEEVIQVESADDETVIVTTNNGKYVSKRVLNCTYSQINKLHRSSNLPLVPLKHEIVEMCLVSLPDVLKDFSVTVMDGPFFSIMPFPTTPYHTLSHVRYTPHSSWVDDENTPVDMQDPHAHLRGLTLHSHFRQMYADVQRYIPALKAIEYKDSIWEVKTVLVKSEADDSRPILFRSDFGLQGYVCIMGGKLDNIYDAFEELASLYDKKI
ncbi:MAG: FAD-binding oxidoreductase [Candidatus Saccharibacteria bacterium]|nr:FAD-binding oxidoreductase [Candidatus Saccharibacteria bacterium]